MFVFVFYSWISIGHKTNVQFDLSKNDLATDFFFHWEFQIITYDLFPCNTLHYKILFSGHRATYKTVPVT